MNIRSTILGVIIGVIITTVIGCTVIAPRQHVTLNHKGTLHVLVDGEVDEDYASSTNIELVIENGRVVDAKLGLLATSSDKVITMQGGGDWLIQHKPLLPTPSPTPLPARVLLENGAKLDFTSTEQVQFINDYGQTVDAYIKLVTEYQGEAFVINNVVWTLSPVATATPVASSPIHSQ